MEKAEKFVANEVSKKGATFLFAIEEILVFVWNIMFWLGWVFGMVLRLYTSVRFHKANGFNAVHVKGSLKFL